MRECLWCVCFVGALSLTTAPPAPTSTSTPAPTAALPTPPRPPAAPSIRSLCGTSRATAEDEEITCGPAAATVGASSPWSSLSGAGRGLVLTLVVALVLFAHLLEAHQELLLFLPFVLVRSLLLWLLGVALLLLLVRLLIVFLLWLLLTVLGLLNQLLGLLGQLAIDVSNTDDRVTKYFEASCDSRLP